MLVDIGVGDDGEVLKSKGFGVVQTVIDIVVHRVSVELGRNDIERLCRQCDIKGICSRTHGEHKPAGCHEIPDTVHHTQLQLTHLLKPEPCGHLFSSLYLFNIPGLILVGSPELAVLSCKIFMMEMKPVILCKLPGEHFLIVDLVVCDFCSVQCERHSGIPGLCSRGSIDRNRAIRLQVDHLHINSWILHLPKDGLRLTCADSFYTHIPESRFPNYI